MTDRANRPPTSRGPASAARPWPVALLLGCGAFLVLFDSLAVATALPSIGAELELPLGVLQSVVTLYSLSIGALLVLGGRVSDLWGPRRVLTASMALCTLAGLVAGLAPGLVVLLLGRVLQGVAAAFALPAALAIAATAFIEEPWRTRVFSVIAGAAWSAGLGGAVLGGLLTDRFGWRAVFLVTVPVAAVASVAALRLLTPDGARGSGHERLDLAGAVLAIAGLTALMLGLGQLSESGHRTRGLLIVCVGLVLLTALATVERRVEHPLVKPRLLRSRRLVGSCVAFGAYCAGYSAVAVVVSLYLQQVHGFSAAHAGLSLAPVLVVGILSASLSGRLLRRYTVRVVVPGAITLCAVVLVGVALLSTGPATPLLTCLALWGVFSGPVYIGLTRESIGDAAPEDRGTASALFESTSHVGGAVAVAGYLSLLGAGLGYGPTELVAAVTMIVGATLACLILPTQDLPVRRRGEDRSTTDQRR